MDHKQTTNHNAKETQHSGFIHLDFYIFRRTKIAVIETKSLNGLLDW